jgi:hypothetical protein
MGCTKLSSDNHHVNSFIYLGKQVFFGIKSHFLSVKEHLQLIPVPLEDTGFSGN